MRLIHPPKKPAGLPEPPPPPVAPRGLGRGARIWLVRHAQVAEEFHTLAYGCADVPLSVHGEEQTAATALAFEAEPLDLVISSDLERALAMGRAIAAPRETPLEVTAELREIDRGAWQGRPKSEFQVCWEAEAEAYWRDPWRWRVPGGDSDASIFARAWPALERGLRAVGGGTLVLTGHANLIRVLLGRALGETVPASYRFSTDPARANLLIDGPEGFCLERENSLPGSA